ncbi:tyrosine-type recombinase/integrase [Nanoarchaeota archaeon]
MATKKRIQYLSPDDISKLESCIHTPRDIILLKIFYETGCTVKEAVGIKEEDVDAVHGQITFPAENTKSKILKRAMISKELGRMIVEFVEHQHKSGVKSKFVFSSRQSSQMTTKRARQLILKFGKKADLGKVLPQMVRYAHVIHAVRKGIPLDAVARQTGLEKIRIVQICDAVSGEELPNQYLKFFGDKDEEEKKLDEYM